MNASTHPQDLIGLIAVAVVLGLRHGFDADHLAAIDGMTRFNAAARPSLARHTGLWFSVGHGVVVMVVAVFVALMATAWTVPGWLEPFGAWASIAVLLLLSLVNFNAMQQAPAGVAVSGFTWRSGLFARFLKASGCWPIMGVGALFAVSFDTLTQAALMAVTGTALRGLAAVIALAGAFVVGMLITDGLNGWWVARLLRQSDLTAVRASRIMCISVASVSLGTALLGIGTRLSPSFAEWADAHETRFGLVIIAIMFISFMIGVRAGPTLPVKAAGEKPKASPSLGPTSR